MLMKNAHNFTIIIIVYTINITIIIINCKQMLQHLVQVIYTIIILNTIFVLKEINQLHFFFAWLMSPNIIRNLKGIRENA